MKLFNTMDPTQSDVSTKKGEDAEKSGLKCLKCEMQFDFSTENGKDEYLAHLFLGHRLIIADVDDVADLQEYLLYWTAAFVDTPLEEYCTTMLLDQLPDGTTSKNEKYYLLSDVLPQDYELRKKLHDQRLEKVLATHQVELTDREYSKECLYCRDVIQGLRANFVEHLFTKHFLQLGKPENLVYVDELIAKVQHNLENLICLYCEKIFKDRATLKEHMRKKGHKKINPNNRNYDKYFLINYRNEKPKRTKTFVHSWTDSKNQHRNTEAGIQTSEMEEYHQNSEESDLDWLEWCPENLRIVCLYCSKNDTEFGNIKDHMLDAHKFDFEAAVRDLNFYQRIKAVNYTRRQVQILRCIACDERHETSKQLLNHMETENHFGIGVRSQWDRPEYFFPTFEDDGVLCVLDDSNENDDVECQVPVICEEPSVKINKEAEKLRLENAVLP